MAVPGVTEAVLGGDLAGAVVEAIGCALGRGGGGGHRGGGGAPSSPAPSADDCGFALLSCDSDDPQAQVRALQQFRRQWAIAWGARMNRLAASRPTVSAAESPDIEAGYRGPRM